MSAPHLHEPDWVHGHPHDPNPVPPGSDHSFLVSTPAGNSQRYSLEQLAILPFMTISNCLIVSTGHGISGPFSFGGTRLLTLLQALLPIGTAWSYVDVQSADGFGTRIRAEELIAESPIRPSLLAWQIDDTALTRQRGLVRLIVPSETDDALKQVKWVERITIA